MDTKYRIIKPRSAQEMITDNTIVKVLAGSHAYGMALPTSDIDHRGIFCADKINILTPFFPISESINMNGEDTVMHELSKFMQLFTAANPNILEILYVDDDCILETSPEYDMLRAVRKKLLSSKVAFTFTGYSYAQIQRIKGHGKWINNPKPVDPPQQVDYVSMVRNYTSEKVFKVNLRDFKENHRLLPCDGNLMELYPLDGYQTFDKSGSLNSTYDKTDVELFLKPDGTRRLPMFILKFNKDIYNQDLDEWSNYWTWKKNRNKKRAALEEQFGYDCKHAAHCVRLLNCGLELLQTGEFLVRRPDAELLLSIRAGAWTYDQVLEFAEHMDNEIKAWYIKTDLPKKPDIKLAASVLLDIQESFWSRVAH